jgi:hypothetical protein
MIVAAAPRNVARMRRLSVRLCVEAGLGQLSATLLVLTLFVPDWIEMLFRVDPDYGSGTLERVVVTVLSVTTVVASLLVRREWRCPREEHQPSVVEQVVPGSGAGNG